MTQQLQKSFLIITMLLLVLPNAWVGATVASATDTHTLSIEVSTGGRVSFDGISWSGGTQTFTVEEGSSATLTISPNKSCKLSKLTVNDVNVTSKVKNNSYTIENIREDTRVVVTFAETTTKTHTLTLSATGNGTLSANGTTARNGTKTLSINDGGSATLTVAADDGYRLKSLKVGGTDVTTKVSGGKYIIAYVSGNITAAAVFEQTPTTSYSMILQSDKHGSVIYGGNTVKGTSKTFSVPKGTNATLTFIADDDYRLGQVTVNGTDVTSAVANNQYTVSNISQDTRVIASFVETTSDFTIGGISYTITSREQKTVMVSSGNVSGVINVPSSVSNGGTTWKVTSIGDHAFADNTNLLSITIASSITSVGSDILDGCTSLAAMIWEPEMVLDGTMFSNTNPNLLLYVKSSKYAPYGVNNLVVDGVARSITLVDAESGNNFYCPRSFTAEQASYTHDYQMTTGRGECRGWETLTLPFAVESISHAYKGEAVPFAAWKSGSAAHPFWLYRLSQSGWVKASSIEANTPYIISMPNNEAYATDYVLAGEITFSATNAEFVVSTDQHPATSGSKTLRPCLQEQQSGGTIYALNVVNATGNHTGSHTEGSVFANTPRRTIHPFEAYIESSDGSRPYIDLFGTTGISEETADDEELIYSLQGIRIKTPRRGIYIVNGKKKVLLSN